MDGPRLKPLRAAVLIALAEQGKFYRRKLKRDLRLKLAAAMKRIEAKDDKR